MYSKDPFARQFHLGWITTMEKVPNSNLSAFLPELIDGLFLILGDPNADIFTSQVFNPPSLWKALLKETFRFQVREHLG
jgi:hypothetical protein